MSLKTLVRIIVPVSILCMALTSCASEPALQVLEHNITVREYTADKSQSTATVTGMAKNSSDWPINGCSIAVTFYDYQGTVVVTKTVAKEQMAPGEVWDFKIELKGAEAWKVARYKISSVNK